MPLYMGICFKYRIRNSLTVEMEVLHDGAHAQSRPLEWLS